MTGNSLKISRAKPKRILVFGTFDGLHPGHEHFFRQARKLSPKPWLIVSVARDSNVKRIKGRRPITTEKSRLAEVKAHSLVDEAILGAVRDYLSHIIKQQPDIIALGYDQTAYVAGLQPALAKRGWQGRIVRLQAFKPQVYKSSLLKSRRVKI